MSTSTWNRNREKKLGINQEYMQENFYYSDGCLYRSKKSDKRHRLNHCDWKIYTDGYRRIRIKRCNFSVHRLVWIFNNGDIPDGLVIDHINRNRLDNRIENLRAVTQLQNLRNNGIVPKSGQIGVRWFELCKTWHARIKVNNKCIHLGYFKDINMAILARKNAELKYEGAVR